MWQKVVKETDDKMKKTIDVTRHEISLIRTGRANPLILEGVRVSYYGAPTPLKQLATITAPDPRSIVVQPYDASSLKEIEKAILSADLGLTPTVDGKIVRISIPTLSQERRADLVKVVKKVSEDARVSIRSVRRDANGNVKKLEMEKKITEDELSKSQNQIQKLTDSSIALIDQASESKEKDLLTV